MGDSFHLLERMDNKTGNWEGLRKQARALENEIDLKLVSFSKLGTNYKHGDQFGDKAPLLGEDTLHSTEQQLESLLTQLSSINDQMSTYATGVGEQRSAAIHHTLQRHTEILQDYRQEFTKTSSNISSMLEREELLSSVQNQISGNKKGRNEKMDSLQRELEHTRNSERMIDEQINIALETRDDLSSKFPLINSLVNKINLRKRRDTIILGSVIGL